MNIFWIPSKRKKNILQANNKQQLSATHILLSSSDFFFLHWLCFSFNVRCFGRVLIWHVRYVQRKWQHGGARERAAKTFSLCVVFLWCVECVSLIMKYYRHEHKNKGKRLFLWNLLCEFFFFGFVCNYSLSKLTVFLSFFFQVDGLICEMRATLPKLWRRHTTEST